MRRFQPYLGGLSVALLLSLGCSDSEGGDTPTNEMIPDFRVITNPTSTTVLARLTSPSVPSIRLPDDQELRVTAEDQVKVMGYAVDPVNGPYYITTLLTPAAEEPIVFTLDRGGAGDATSQVTNPPGVQLEEPAAGTVVRVETDLTVSWSPSGLDDEVAVVFTTTDCTGGGSTAPHGVVIEGDPGTATIRVPASLMPVDLPFGGSCAVSLRVERTRFGTVDPAFADGGSVMARQLDFRTITVAP